MSRKLSLPQFSLRTVFLGVTVLCVLLALFASSNEFVRLLAGCVIAVNVLGGIAGLLVTYVFKLPRDGGYSFQDESSDESNDS